MSNNQEFKPLHGLRVLELARVLAGPWAGQTLADLGADVLKVESPQGDETRSWGPPFIKRHNGDREAAYFHACNRGKRSTVIDFSDQAGQQKVQELAKQADVVIENFKCGSLAKYNLDFDALIKINPKLVYCSITGFGLTGPYRQRAGYDFVIQGMSGIMDLTGEKDGSPQKMGVAYADIFTGMYAVVAIQSALVEVAKTAKGLHIDLSLYDTMISVLANQAMNYLVSNESPTRQGNAHPNIAPYEVFECQDRAIIIAVGNDKQFSALSKGLDLENLTSDSKFVDNQSRLAHREHLHQCLQTAIQRWQAEPLLQVLNELGVPCGPINQVSEALTDPHTVARGLVQTSSTAHSEDQIPTVSGPIKVVGRSIPTPSASPILDQDQAKWLD